MRKLVWKDRKRHLGLPLSFTRYSMSEDRLYIETGFFNLREEEILLYRVRDTTLTRSLGQRILGVGTITVKSSDASIPTVELRNVAHPKQVKEKINDLVEAAKDRRRLRSTEILDSQALLGDGVDLDGDGIIDTDVFSSSGNSGD